MGENKIPDPMQNSIHRSLATSSWDYPSELNDPALQPEGKQEAVKRAVRKFAESKKKCSGKKKDEAEIHPTKIDMSCWDPIYGRIPGTEKY